VTLLLRVCRVALTDCLWDLSHFLYGVTCLLRDRLSSYLSTLCLRARREATFVRALGSGTPFCCLFCLILAGWYVRRRLFPTRPVVHCLCLAFKFTRTFPHGAGRTLPSTKPIVAHHPSHTVGVIPLPPHVTVRMTFWTFAFLPTYLLTPVPSLHLVYRM